MKTYYLAWKKSLCHKRENIGISKTDNCNFVILYPPTLPALH